MISFRQVEQTDINKLYIWMNNPHVKRWFGGEVSYDDVERKMLPRICGEKPVESYIIVHDGIDIGYIQSYMILDYPEYARVVQVNDDTAGLDLYIGDPGYVYRGLGPEIMKKFLNEYIFADEKINSCIVGPEPMNISAIKAYRKAGFEYLKTIQMPVEENPEAIHVIKRTESNLHR